jgi:NADH:ubiquinone oxidoreductase subunit E
VAATLELPYAHVYGVATFYTMFRREPAGTNILRVCTNISCMLRGAYDVLARFEHKLGFKAGEGDAEFSLVEEECIAACANAPAVVCGTRYFLDVTPEQVDGIISELRQNPRPEEEVV